MKGVGNLQKIATTLGNIIARMGVKIGQGIGGILQFTLRGLALGLKALGDPLVFKGILAIGLLGISLLPFVFAMKLMTGLDWESLKIATVGLIAFTAAAFGLGALLLSGVGGALFGAGIVGLYALGLALIPLGVAAKLAGSGMKDLGEGLKMSVDSLIALTQLSFVNTITSLKNLTSTIGDLSEAISKMPKIDISPLSTLANIPSFNLKSTNNTQLASGNFNNNNDDVIKAINDLKSSLENGGISANVYIDTQKMDSVYARTMAFKGSKSPQPAFI